MAPGLPLLPDNAGYRLYIESLFDELSTEVKVLFDRRDPASVLWPKRAAFEQLLEVLNGSELAGVWGEDETIGWVYQFFNAQDERRTMRDESLTPRTGRELAVRNQFFTPRFVVDFLVANTLGRLWVEMQEGSTALATRCEYLVSSALGETRDTCSSGNGRPKKDPRDLKVLDPACGSGHFLLAAFDLLLTIYEEAWQADSAPKSELTHRTLRDDYTTLAQLREVLPELILRHNLFGVDIDRRATQIAAFALWMRAQRAYQDLAVPRQQRRIISRTNVVLAEAMPGSPLLRDQFIDGLEPALQAVVRDVFARMELAGSAGPLLKIDRDIADVVRAYVPRGGPLFQEDELTGWTRLNADVRAALERYANGRSTNDAFVHRMFSDDAARGMAFIELSRLRYDIILMNPPFGEFIDPLFQWLAREYPRSKRDLAAAFVDRGLELLAPRGLVGALFSRKLFFLSTQG